jgi:cytoskeleton protein RodZ
VTEPAAGDAGATGAGAALRQARERLGLTGQQAAERLTLDQAVISALENDDYAALGAGVFARGHLRRYATLLGLDADAVLAAYERSRAHLEPPSLIPRARLEMPPERSRVNWSWVTGAALGALLIAGIAAYVAEYGLRLPSRAHGGSPPVADGSAAAAAASVPDPVTGPGTAAASSAAPAAAVQEPDAAPVPAPLPAGHVSIRLRFAANSWAEIYDGTGQAVLYDVGRAGTERSVAAAAPLSVTLGNAQGVSVTVNGRAVALPPVPAGQTVARFSVGVDGALR